MKTVTSILLAVAVLSLLPPHLTRANRLGVNQQDSLKRLQDSAEIIKIKSAVMHEQNDNKARVLQQLTDTLKNLKIPKNKK